MEEEEIKKICESAGVSTALVIGYHGREGDIERKVMLEGFNFTGEPRLRFMDSKDFFKDTRIGYDNVYSLKEVNYSTEKDAFHAED
jgi:hypothetical protein